MAIQEFKLAAISKVDDGRIEEARHRMQMAVKARIVATIGEEYNVIFGTA